MMTIAIMGGRSKLMLRELVANTLFVSAMLGTLIVVHTERASALFPAYRPFDLFLYLFVGLLTLWEILGLSLGSALNPTVSFCLYLAGEPGGANLFTVIPAQFAAHALAVLAVRRLAGPHFTDALQLFAPPRPHKDLGLISAVAFEAAATAVMCIAAVSLHHVMPTAPIMRTGIIIAVIVGLTSVGAEYTGSCMNPAMSLSLSFFDGRWHMHSVYWFGPLIGAVLTAGLHNLLFNHHTHKTVGFANEEETHANGEGTHSKTE